jgi:hypothetical protein
MARRFIFGVAILSSTVVLAACTRQVEQRSAPAASGAAYRLSAEPVGAQGVAEIRKSAKADENVVVVGRIGGDVKPWVEGMAAFLLTDTSMTPCSERAGDSCPTPWDYCCEVDRLKDAKVMVKLVDQQGQIVKNDARQLLDIKELDTVVVRGRAQRDEAGNLTILADGVYRRS